MSETSAPAARAIDRSDVEAAYERIKPHIRRTPTLEVRPRDLGLDGAFELCFKLEFLQHTGSFKARGATNAARAVPPPPAGFVAASGGNHGAAVAYAAAALGAPAHIFVPEISSPAKTARIESYGAVLHRVGQRYADALAASEAHVAETGAQAIHAYDQDETLAGQGTVALEFLEQSAPEVMLVATGGGGLIGGMAAYTAGRARILSVEPEAAPTYHRARQAGAPVDAPAGGIAADSLAPRRVGAKMFPIAEAFVEDAVLVSDDAIIAAQKTLWSALRVVAEPGGAAAFAALASGAYRPQPGERVGVLLCGANSSAVDFG